MGSYGPSITVEEEDSPIPGVKHYHPGVCGTCYEAPSEKVTLLRCSQCLLVSYCSRVCQKKDWSFHKSICLVNKAKDNCSIFSSLKYLHTEKNENRRQQLYQLCSNLALTCSINLKRSLTLREKEIFWYPRVCEVCKDSTGASLSECKNCHSVFYCSIEHKNTKEEEHKNWCSYLKLCLQCDTVEALEGIQDLPFPTIIDEDYKELGNSELKEYLYPQFSVDSSKTLDTRFVTMISERLSFPLSLQYALEKLGGKLDCPSYFLSSDSLRIHVIGAESSVELLGIIRWEYFLHRLPSIKCLHVVFIGPNLLKTGDEVDELSLENHCVDDTGSTRCVDCTEKNRIVIYEMATMFYHQYKDSNYFKKPDALVAFNCGFHEHEDQPLDTWKESLKLITKMNVPLIFTSYTKTEAKKDLEVIEKACKSIVVELEPHLNPYHSPRPFRDPTGEDGNLIYFYNQYLTCVRGTTST